MTCMLVSFAANAEVLRERISFDKDWQFAFGDASSPAKDFGCGTEYFNYLTKAASIHNEGPYSPKFDASGWTIVDLPHDWVVDLPYAAEASHSHGYKTVGYKYPETSVGWYRKAFTVPSEDYGKHIWLQKPFTQTIEEGRILADLAKKHNRVVQVGSWQRSVRQFALVCELVRNGRIGDVRKVEA